jgi:hypothetical protein
MKAKDFVLPALMLIGFGIYATAKEDSARNPAMTLPKKNGVVCAQDVSVLGAEERINGKLGGSETTLTLANKFGSVTDGKITGLSVSSIPDKKSPTGYTHIICASIAGN